MCDNDCGLELDDEEEYVKHEEFFCSIHKQQVDKIIERLAQIDAKKIELDMESRGLYAELTNLRKCFVRHIHDWSRVLYKDISVLTGEGVRGQICPVADSVIPHFIIG